MSINRKFILGISSLICLFAILVVAYQSVTNIENVTLQAQEQQSGANQDITRLLNTTNDIMLDRVKSSMALLKERSLALGKAQLGSRVTVANRQAPDLLFGQASQANQYELVDQLTQVMGGTATLFARDGDQFVRVSTNVKKDGQRSIGTVLAPTGKAMRAINTGQPFYGEVDILGKPYIAGYEPIFDGNNVIGIWYVGYSADMQSIAEAIQESRILQQGFVALYDAKDQMRMHSSHVSDQTVQQALQDSAAWHVKKAEFAPWGYQIVTAYSNAEVSEQIWAQSLRSAGLILVSGLVLILFNSWLVNRIVGKPLAVFVQAIEDIAQGEGDLTQRFAITTQDELGKMAHGFNLLLSRIQQTIKEARQAANEVASSTERLLGLASQSHHASAEQTKETEQVAAASHELSLSAQEVARNTADAEVFARQANDDVRQVGDTLSQTVANIRRQAHDIEASSAAVGELVDAGNQISRVLAVIREIAEQTNLLALNASIEAARAGAHGRGFAVVADEVRSLASRTQSSTEEIRGMIERIQHSGQRASAQMNSNQQAARDNATQAQTADEVLKTVLTAVDRISQLNIEIASSVEQQRLVAADVSKNVDHIRQSSSENLAYSSETTQACESLAQLAQQLSDQLKHYKV
ncbi:methyl-accepting chemotaxis protein [Vibrio tritonius]|uniref:methyl-accepting chemotaxis protein n=1 Tax=Vibrio tritonius TaxID=1435069 RepID=UPI00315D89EB